MMHIQPTGDMFQLASTNVGHFSGPQPLSARPMPAGAEAEHTGEGSFGDMLMNGLSEVSRLDRHHENLSIQAVVDPDSVNPHDVTIAASQASLALNLTRNIVDRVVQGYQEITNLR